MGDRRGREPLRPRWMFGSPLKVAAVVLGIVGLLLLWVLVQVIGGPR